MLSSFVKFILTLHSLAGAAHEQAPTYLNTPTAVAHALAAQIAATDEVPAEVLLGMAFVESRYQPRAVSRLDRGRRIVGVPTWTDPPDAVSGPYFCGVVQVEAGRSWRRCKEFQNIFVAYRTAVQELTLWIRYSHGNIENALGGYGCGFIGAKNPDSCGGKVSYAARVLYRARLLRSSEAKS